MGETLLDRLEIAGRQLLRQHRHRRFGRDDQRSFGILELACAIAHSPRVLLLDEPSAGIAQREVEALRDVLLQVRADTGAALAIVEHDIPLLSSMCDSLVCMHLGRVIATGTPDTVLSDPMVVSSYLGTALTTIQRSNAKVRA